MTDSNNNNSKSKGYVQVYTGNGKGKTTAALGITTAEITTDAGVAAFEAWLASNIGKRAYYPHTEPTVLNVNMAGIETVGRNLLDPTTGKARIIGAYSDVYGNYYGITGTHGAITFTSDMGETSTITPDEDGKFLLEEPGELSVADAGADCCVFLWWDGTQTDYVEHKDEKTYLDATHIYGKLNGTGDLVRVWPTGMPKINDIKDMLRIEDGQVVARRVIGEADLGVTWFLSSDNIFYNTSIIDGPQAKYTNLLCANYSVNGNIGTTGMPDKSIGANNGGGTTLYIKDSSYETATDLKAALTGQLLYFKLATPKIYTDLVYQGSEYFADGTPVTLPLNYPADNWGIERVLPLNTSEALATAKPELTCKYSIDAVETMNTHADEIEDLYDKNEELDAKKPNKTGDYPGMAVGSAKVLEGTDNKVEDFVFTAPQCADGLAKLNEVRGKSLVWNQLVQNGDFADGGNTPTGWVAGYGTTFDNSNADYLKASGNYHFSQISQTPITVGHILLCTCRVRYESEENTGSSYVLFSAVDSASTNLKPSNDGSWTILSKIGPASRDGQQESYGLFRGVMAGNSLLFDKHYGIKVIDLTLMFGAGNEPTTVAEFEALY